MVIIKNLCIAYDINMYIIIIILKIIDIINKRWNSFETYLCLARSEDALYIELDQLDRDTLVEYYYISII